MTCCHFQFSVWLSVLSVCVHMHSFIQLARLKVTSGAKMENQNCSGALFMCCSNMKHELFGGNSTNRTSNSDVKSGKTKDIRYAAFPIWGYIPQFYSGICCKIYFHYLTPLMPLEIVISNVNNAMHWLWLVLFVCAGRWRISRRRWPTWNTRSNWRRTRMPKWWRRPRRGKTTWMKAPSR